MLVTLYNIGKQLSAQVGEFYSIIDYPKVDETKKKQLCVNIINNSNLKQIDY